MKTELRDIFLLTITFLLSSNIVSGQETIAEDKASNYTLEELASLENLGTGFGPWNSILTDDASVELLDANGNGANSAAINTDALSFALIASPTDVLGNRVDLGREFLSALSDGDTLSFDIAWNWVDGLKGVSLSNGSWESEDVTLTIDFDITGFYVNSDSVAPPPTEDDWNGSNPWRQEGEAMHFSIVKTAEGLTYSVKAITPESPVDFSGTVEGVNADRINFFNDDGLNWGGSGQGSLFFNSLKIVSGMATSNEEELIQYSFKLEQNYPNPFNPETQISYSLEQAGPVELSIYNLLGQQILTIENGFKSAGSHLVSLNASNLSSGVYIYTLRTEMGVLSRKMTVLK
ncbi:MAG: T9SS C-terminal target domain-containing protein [Balneola sp.]|nr:MAG: T9SS C-terminal target domain-containing protein [Balneola sp.]